MIMADKIESLVLDVLRSCSLIATLRDAVIGVVRERLERPTTGSHADAAALRARLVRIKQLFEWGEMEKAEYLRKREQVQQQLARLQPHAPACSTWSARPSS